jgi:hypothetical protein
MNGQRQSVPLKGAAMSTWKKVVLVNGGGLAGIVLFLFIVSTQTPLWLWATLSGVALAVLNYVCFGWRRETREGPNTGAKSTAIIVLGLPVLLLDLILRYMHR